ncbi:hypothetical protein ASG89_07510 [Paenibacillus sp. Soil766]|uniref:DUF4362 domain-containing protein n=1 Tax=Paenibacillus sp. Soil766 TaxID=1736404 RepID=UPI00070C084E|nr:DUF4362 domain-containing protein [Paenibacillus sp. Soil766]KRE93336.1 hypothetical protein ASG89_07510 [Paenibacillus sp. Soil766]
MIKRGIVLLISILVLSSCSNEKYDVDKATAKGDVINIHGRIINVDRFNQFLKNVEGQTKSQIRITQMTIEGDPIYYDLAYNEDKLSYTYNNKADKHGDGKRLRTECTRMSSAKVERGISYSLDGCKDDSIGQTFSFVIPESGN